VHKFQIRNMIL